MLSGIAANGGKSVSTAFGLPRAAYEVELSRLLERAHCDSANLRLAQYLHHESPYSYTLLHSDGAAATNNRANGRCVGRRSSAAARV